MTGDLPSISSTTIRADAGPVEIPQAPWPAQMNRPGASGMRTDQRATVHALRPGARARSRGSARR